MNTQEPTPNAAGGASTLTDGLGVLGLLADIRAAVGDPTGKLMQDELVAHCSNLRTEAMRAEGEWQRAQRAEGEVRELRDAIQRTIDENGHLADGDNCTLIRLVRVMETPNVEGNRPPRTTGGQE